MGSVIGFPGADHAVRASAGSRAARRASTSVVTPAAFASSAATIRDHHSEGMRPRDRQLLTAELPTPTREATAEVPPRALITSSMVESMNQIYSRSVNRSSVHTMDIVTNCELLPYAGMARALKEICERLKLVEWALGLKPAQLADEAKISRTAWTQYKDPDFKRRITLAAAYKLKDRFGITLEYIYDDDPTRLPGDIRDKVRKKEAA